MNESTPETVTIQLTKGYTAVVDAIDADLSALAWYPFDNGRNRYAIGAHSVFLHGVILERVIGRALNAGEMCDHKDDNGLNCRRDNLRVATRSQNAQNSRRPSHSLTGYKGVSKSKNQNLARPYMARIYVNKRRLFLGNFATAQEAHEAYKEAAKLHFCEFARFE